jgi:phi13 family phage major tail protein
MKIIYGLKNVVCAKYTIKPDGTYEYATPFKIPGAVSLSLSTSGDSNDFYADDVIYNSSNANQGYEGDLEMALIPEEFKTDILGETKDSNGALIENADAEQNGFALGFEASGDVKARRTWFYNCNASRPNVDAKTKEKSISPSTEKLTIKAMPRLNDHAIKVVMELTDSNKTKYDSFFSEVYEKTASV